MSNYHVSGKNKSFKVTKEGGKRASYINVPTQKEAIVVAKKLYSEN